MHMHSCIFCDIKEGRAEASIVYQDERLVAFMDIRPVNPGHVLIIPKIHASSLAELDSRVGAHLFKVGMRINKALRKSGISCEGVNLIVADGEAAGQEVFHVHLHVIPRFAGDGFESHFGPQYDTPLNRTTLDAIADQIRSSLLSS